ncbi:tetratricopeptide repeat protein [Aliikangiella coralliicola]|uniref:Uncharacterized protein n=1 Tax=Aliikangiella coralliicola TaxID=2592383 RepID=A0A545UCT8_9GAMM|nr:hypothetical protein [Aliikangiella coralliicola]TQV87284.1 hypothetical protein FLL46_12595 [Aliikangiella coralliicola]
MRLLVLLVVLLTACGTQPTRGPLTGLSTQPDLPMLDDSHFGPVPPIESVDSIFELTAEQKKDFLRHFNSLRYRSLLPNRKISRYLRDKLDQFNFYSDTLTAHDALSQNLGNCLSLAIVTKALADVVNVEVGYELVSTPPIYQKEGDFVLSAQHVRTLLFEPRIGEYEERQLFWRGFIRVDYFPSAGTRALRNVDEIEFYTMYYRNKAAEALTKDNDNLAFWYLKKGLELNKNDPHVINMLAIIHSRAGYPDYAERIYQYGLQYGNERFELLHNYHLLLVRLERTEDAAKIAAELSEYDDPDPYKWVSLGNIAYEAEDYSTAIYYYKKAAKMADYLHEPYEGIARAQFSLGKLKSARQAIKKAIENTHKKETTSMYQAKYDYLTQLIANKNFN